VFVQHPKAPRRSQTFAVAVKGKHPVSQGAGIRND
jgi:hypothetical protein